MGVLSYMTSCLSSLGHTASRQDFHSWSPGQGWNEMSCAKTGLIELDAAYELLVKNSNLGSLLKEIDTVTNLPRIFTHSVTKKKSEK